MSVIEAQAGDDPDFSGKLAATRFLFLRLLQLRDLLMAQVEKDMTGLPLSVSRSRVIGTLVRAGGPLTVPDVAERLGLSRQGISKLVALMIKDGFIKQAENPGHVRAKFLLVTAKGREAYRAAKRSETAMIMRFSAVLDEAEIAGSMQMMERLIKALPFEN